MVHHNTWRAKVAPWCHHKNKILDTGVTMTLKIQDNTKVLLQQHAILLCGVVGHVPHDFGHMVSYFLRNLTNLTMELKRLLKPE